MILGESTQPPDLETYTVKNMAPMKKKKQF